jgi:hypothetical protein
MNTLSTPHQSWEAMAHMEPVFHKNLMPHQVEVVRTATQKRHFLIAHEQGTGKTITGIMLAQSALAHGARQVLVICPPSLTFNWVQEFYKWAPKVTTTIINKRAPLDIAGAEYAGLPDAQVLIVTDGALHGYNRWFIGGDQRFTWDDENAFDEFGNRIIPDYFTRNFGRGVDALIVDECQRVSSGRAGRGRAFTHLCAERPFMSKWLLSGTPFTKTRVGLYNLMQGLNAFGAHTIDDKPADAQAWLNHFAPVAGTYGSRGQANTEQLHAEMFHPVTGWAHRVLTADVITDLPNLGRICRNAELSGKKARDYKRAEENLQQWLVDSRGSEKAERMMKVEALTRVAELRRLAGQAKVESVIAQVELTMETAEEGEHDPVLVVCNHTDVRETITAHFVKKGLRVGGIHGTMTTAEKQGTVDAWQAGELDIVVANVISSSVGFTMTEGRHIVFAELPWNSMDVVQAEARLLRKGQGRDCVSQVMLGVQPSGKRTIDDRLWGLLSGKFAEAKAVMDGEEVESFQSEESMAMAILRTYADELGVTLD